MARPRISRENCRRPGARCKGKELGVAFATLYGTALAQMTLPGESSLAFRIALLAPDLATTRGVAPPDPELRFWAEIAHGAPTRDSAPSPRAGVIAAGFETGSDPGRSTRARRLSAIKQLYRFRLRGRAARPTTRRSRSRARAATRRLPKTLTRTRSTGFWTPRATTGRARPTGCATPA
jgi:hypothetical protein